MIIGTRLTGFLVNFFDKTPTRRLLALKATETLGKFFQLSTEFFIHTESTIINRRFKPSHLGACSGCTEKFSATL